MQSYEKRNWRLGHSVNKRAITGHFPKKFFIRTQSREVAEEIKTTDIRDFRDINHERKRDNPFNL